MSYWSDEEKEFLVRNYKDMCAREIGEALGRSRSSVKGMAKKMGVRKSDNSGCFKKGMVAWNKGKSYTAAGSEKGWFRKGHLPKNTKSDGYISARRDTSGRVYLHIRLALRVWVPLHRYLWERVNGDIPSGMVLRFKNGDTFDCRLQNMELISQADNLIRNYDREKMAASQRKMRREFRDLDNDNYVAWCITGEKNSAAVVAEKFPELVELKRVQLKLKRSIKYASE